VAKNRLHLDLWFADEPAADLRRAELESIAAVSAGYHGSFWLMLDPEGNEFCLCWK
jgi:hypothetical protein